MKVGYFPGCSLHATAAEFDRSVRAVAGKLDVELVEIDDWSCCGASSAHSTSHLLAVALAARNLALAHEQGMSEVLAPCAMCYSRLATARHEMKADRKLALKVERIVGRPCPACVRVVNVVEMISGMSDGLRARTTAPLAGMKVACYYGCLLLRPHEVTGFDDPEMPQSMEGIVSALGGEPVQWHMGTECCGGGLSLSRTGSVIRLGRAILGDARASGAEAVAVACPMCHSNLDFRQRAMELQGGSGGIPIVYLPQLAGLAMGSGNRELGLDRHYVSTESLAAIMSRKPAEQAPAGAPARDASGQADSGGT